MITAVDTNILLDIFLPDPKFGEESLMRIEKAYEEGALVISSVVYAELSPQFDKRGMLDAALEKLSIQVVPLGQEEGFLAGLLWRSYRKQEKSRDRIITDFLIGASAKIQADRFLTRDRGFYRKYFKGLKMV